MAKNLLITAALVLIGQIGYSQTTATNSSTKRPNVGVILADDMGYSDMEMFGSEKNTQHGCPGHK